MKNNIRLEALRQMPVKIHQQFHSFILLHIYDIQVGETLNFSNVTLVSSARNPEKKENKIFKSWDTRLKSRVDLFVTSILKDDKETSG